MAVGAHALEHVIYRFYFISGGDGNCRRGYLVKTYYALATVAVEVHVLVVIVAMVIVVVAYLVLGDTPAILDGMDKPFVAKQYKYTQYARTVHCHDLVLEINKTHWSPGSQELAYYQDAVGRSFQAIVVKYFLFVG